MSLSKKQPVVATLRGSLLDLDVVITLDNSYYSSLLKYVQWTSKHLESLGHVSGILASPLKLQPQAMFVIAFLKFSRRLLSVRMSFR